MVSAIDRVFQRFFKTEALSGLLLLVSAIAALGVANSPWGDWYTHLWETPLAVGVAGYALTLTVHGWINDVLMAVFFLLVGLEIKRELIAGELSSGRQAALPIAGAVGGMVVPALVYAAINHSGVAARGWAVPMATDIAFAIGTLALIAPNLPSSAKVFLTALAIVDDMGAVAVIAIFYTAAISGSAMLGAVAALGVLVALNLARIDWVSPFLLVGVALWWYVHASGVHSTIAGVLLALSIPAASRVPGRPAPLLRLEHALHGVSAYLIMPIFALSNAGVRLGGGTLDWAVILGIVAGLALGKTIGISAFALAATSTKRAALPPGVGRATIVGCAAIGGIGFTMSLFIANLAFEGTPLIDSAKVGILCGSLASALVGFAMLKMRTKSPAGETLPVDSP
jgi:Na+:H+ antiporter, NhaA family